MLDWLLSLPFVWLLSGSRHIRPSAKAAARRLEKYEEWQNIMVPFFLKGSDLGVKISFFEIRVMKDYPNKSFGWWDDTLLGEFKEFMGTMEEVNVQADGLVSGKCRSTDGREISVSLQRDDLEILRRAFSF